MYIVLYVIGALQIILHC